MSATGAGIVAGKVALVTGAAAGMGEAAAVLFAREGAAAVVAVDVDTDGVLSTAAKIEELGVTALALTVDIAREDQVGAMVETTVARFGRLDCAFNNAGVPGLTAPMADCDLDDFRNTIEVMVMGTYFCLRHELRQMVAQGAGAIVNTASVGSFIASPGRSAYVAAKHAVAGLTRNAAIESVRHGIRVNAIAPGATMGRMMVEQSGAVPGLIERIADAQPGGRIAEPIEQAQAAVWLCSDRASFINGALLTTDNGATIAGTMTQVFRS